MISPSLKYKVTVHLYRKVLKKNPLLRGSPELIEFIIHRLETKLTQPEQKLMKIGEKGNCMYFIARGEVEVYTLDQSLNE